MGGFHSGVLKGGYGERLISVSDKSEADVVRACMQTLHSGQSLVVAIDGALNLSAPTIDFSVSRLPTLPFALALHGKCTCQPYLVFRFGETGASILCWRKWSLRIDSKVSLLSLLAGRTITLNVLLKS